MRGSAKTYIGIAVRDWFRYRRAIGGEGSAYLALCNRSEKLEAAPDGSGFRCNWRWTSDLHAPKYVPTLGLALLRRALRDHPIERSHEPATTRELPVISFLIGHRGEVRLPHLLGTLESIAAQRGVNVECVVVEQDDQPRVGGRLPGWVRHVHTPPPSQGMPYCRAWTFNVGARYARGKVLVLHDNDMLVSSDYARTILGRFDAGFDVMNLKRFIFYLGPEHSRAVLAEPAALFKSPPAQIVQNLEAGGSVAIGAEAFARIGGMDESFVGWGGEDNEFWERAQSLRLWPYGSLPLVHLWHPPQPEKLEQKPATAEFYAERARVPVQERIAELVSRQIDDPGQMNVRWVPSDAVR